MIFQATTGQELLEKLAVAARRAGFEVAWDHSHDFAHLKALWLSKSPVIRSVIQKLTAELATDLKVYADKETAYARFERHLASHDEALKPLTCVVQAISNIDLEEANRGLDVIGLELKRTNAGYELVAKETAKLVTAGDVVFSDWRYSDVLSGEDGYHGVFSGMIVAADMDKAAEHFTEMNNGDTDMAERDLEEEIPETYYGVVAKNWPSEYVNQTTLRMNHKRSPLTDPKWSVDVEIQYDPHDLKEKLQQALSEAVEQVKNKYK